MTTTDENTRHESEARALTLSAAHAEVLRLLLRYGIDDTCSNRKAAVYTSVLRKLDPARASPIHGVLKISTRHLRPADHCFLDHAASPHAIQGTAAMKGVFGWLVYAHHERTCSRISDTLWTIMVRARDLGCDYILFDMDAPRHSVLPIFDPDTGARIT